MATAARSLEERLDDMQAALELHQRLLKQADAEFTRLRAVKDQTSAFRADVERSAPSMAVATADIDAVPMPISFQIEAANSNAARSAIENKMNQLCPGMPYAVLLLHCEPAPNNAGKPQPVGPPWLFSVQCSVTTQWPRS